MYVRDFQLIFTTAIAFFFEQQTDIASSLLIYLSLVFRYQKWE
jgi:hypothetical protein